VASFPEGGLHSRNSVDPVAEARRSHRDDSVAFLLSATFGALDR
jgi:hypothetical protein